MACGKWPSFTTLAALAQDRSLLEKQKRDRDLPAWEGALTVQVCLCMREGESETTGDEQT